MKKRADYILEKVINSNVNNVETMTNMDEKIAEDSNHANKENVKPFHRDEINDDAHCFNPMDQTECENSPENIRNISPSSSIIENSPERAIPYNDPKTFLTSQCEKTIDVCRIELDPEHTSEKTNLSAEIEKEQSKKIRISPSSSSSSSSSSRSSSSSSSSSSDKSNKSNRTIDRPSTSMSARKTACRPKNTYRVSPINSNESDVDLSDSDPTYTVHRSRSRLRKSSSSSNNSSPSSNNVITHSGSETNVNEKRSKKRQRNPSKWKQNVAKILRNSGQAYISCSTKKEVSARSVKAPCKCKLKCYENINDDDRNILFQTYWALGNIELQRCYIRSCMVEIKPRYKYTNADRPRLPNNAFYFTVNGNKIRVCKTFFINTLDISDRQIRTVKNKTDPQGFISKDIRGKHSSRKPTDPTLIENIKQHINSIPRIESHYLREYISGDKTVMDIWRDFDKLQKEQGKPTCDYWLYYDIFNKDFNIGFYQPKKDRCDLCLDFELAAPNRKIEIKEKYDEHLQEKELCRKEKRLDRENIDEINICAIYDLQAVMQCPTGETSSFYYKSKLNCLNFTIVELLKKTETGTKRSKNGEENEIGAYGNVQCYFWDETQGKRGANEIGSCVLNYLNQLNEQNPNKKLNVTFYSDNTYSQNKNKYITSLYCYAVTCLENIKTITHKFLIKGHTQNEGDNVHSLIEKEIKKNKKAGPIYAPYQYVTLIKNARKNGKPFIVTEVTYDFFFDIKKLQEDWGYNYNENEHKNNIQWNDVKVLKFSETEPFAFYYKTSYTQNEFTMVNIRNKRKKMANVQDIILAKAFPQKLELSEQKKKDLRDLIKKNLIPSYYADFYNTIL